ncbi:hypothetical protein RRSWK_02471 [Rhodopirellula sp. SWK7]|nr:hypothetical protein RRSWK_02471 [Rhodopirellula sp. SWK7]
MSESGDWKWEERRTRVADGVRMGDWHASGETGPEGSRSTAMELCW